MLHMLKRSLLVLLTMFFLGACTTKGKSYRIGVDMSWPSLGVMRREATIYAFTDELLRTIAIEENVIFERINTNEGNLTLGLKTHQYDGILSAITPRVSMNNLYEFSEPFLNIGPVLLVCSDSHITSLKEMQGSMVGVCTLRSEALLRDLYPKVTTHYYNSLSGGMEALISHHIDAVLIESSLIASSYMRDLYRGKVKLLSLPSDNLGLRLLTLHGQNGELIQTFNRGLNKLHDNGTYRKLLQKWGLG